MGSVRALYQRMKLLATFARILRVDDSGDIQLVQLEGLIGEIREGVQRLGEFGFASNPPPDSQAVLASLGGSRGTLAVVATEDRASRPKNLPSGASELYASDGTRVRVNPDGTILIDGDSIAIVVTGDADITATGDVNLTATGDVKLTAATVRTGPATEVDGLAFLSHFHNDPVSGVTGPAQGVPIP